MTQYRSPESVLAEMRHKKNYWDMQKKYDFSASANAEAKSKFLIEDNTIVYFVDDVFTVKSNALRKSYKELFMRDLIWTGNATADGPSG